jgi:hypothetical protein
VPTPTADQAHLRLVLHVDAAGQVRLLKSVTVFDQATNGGPADIKLVTDPARYPQAPVRGKRISAAAYDFGEGKAVALLNQLATAVAEAAGTTAGDRGQAATNAANQVLADADVDAQYRAFAGGSILLNAALGSAASASSAAVTAKGTNGNAAQLFSAAQSAATNDARLVTARTNALALQNAALFSDPRYLGSVNAIALAVANAAATAAGMNASLAQTGLAATNAANLALAQAAAAPTATSSGYTNFIASPAFRTNAPLAAAAAAAAATTESARAGSTTESIVNSARSAALQAMNASRAFAAADAVPLFAAALAGDLSPGGRVEGELYLGPNHPTNPFRHRRHPDHTAGMEIVRRLTLAVGTNAPAQVGFGVDRLSGVYQEEIFGLHKKLGPQQDIGLKTEGAFSLNRISLVDTLNP